MQGAKTQNDNTSVSQRLWQECFPGWSLREDTRMQLARSGRVGRAVQALRERPELSKEQLASITGSASTELAAPGSTGRGGRMPGNRLREEEDGRRNMMGKNRLPLPIRKK